MEPLTDLLTPLRAAHQLRIPLENVKDFLRANKRSSRSRVGIDELRAWLAERAETRRRDRERWEAIEIWTEQLMLLDRFGLGEEHLGSVHACEYCGEQRLAAAIAERLGLVDAHTCGPTSASTSNES